MKPPIISLDAPIRDNPKRINTLCANCVFLGRKCFTARRTTELTSDNYVRVVKCDEYQEGRGGQRIITKIKIRDFPK